MQVDIKVKRVYDEYEISDGFRVLVDRIWPRGMSKERIKADLWLREIAPSNDLRKWFDHEADRWEEFKRRYFAELDKKGELIHLLVEKASKSTLTLLYSASSKEYNQAVVLREYLLSKMKQ